MSDQERRTKRLDCPVTEPEVRARLLRVPQSSSSARSGAALRCLRVDFGVPVTGLTYFTVYGPHQRPDMVIHRMIETALRGRPFQHYCDGLAVGNSTYVGDIVRANMLAVMTDPLPGTVMNIAGGSSTSVSELLATVGTIAGNALPIERHHEQPDDVHRTGGSTDLAHSLLGWKPQVSLAEGIEAQVEWHRSRHSTRS